MSRRRLVKNREPVTVYIESLSHEGRGIGHINGKTVFVDGALPTETINCQIIREKSRYSEARLLEIIDPASGRIRARCDFYNVCGGCSFQHVDPEYQLQHKQTAMLDQLQRVGKIQPEEMLEPLRGPVWGYRRRARLGVKYVEKKQKLLVGFRERYSPYIAEMNHCEVLHPGVSHMLEDLQSVISQLSIYRKLPQIEVAVGENRIALVLRHLDDLDAEDRQLLKQFENEKNVYLFLQPGGLDTVQPLSPDNTDTLYYDLPEWDIRMNFMPNDFIQVNAGINRKMIGLTLSLLDPGQEDNILDLFCGLGNFSLPLAKFGKQVDAIEGDNDLIERARENAMNNGINNVNFQVLDLSSKNLQATFLQNQYNKVLLDPPRTGADIIINQLPLKTVEKLVYVSCNPATLARDAGILVQEHGFRLQKAGVMDMFPHTTHIESIALFVH